jgi:CRISPR-associated endonuclease Cas1
LSKHGVALQARSGALLVRLGDGTERLFQPAEHGLRAVVLAGHGSSITGDAIAWMVREKVAILISSNSTEFISNFNAKTGEDALLLFAPEPRADASRRALAIRQKQHAAALDGPKTLLVAGGVVARKLASSGFPRDLTRSLVLKLGAAKTTDDIRHIEAQAAQIWWEQWQGFELRFKGPAPDHWKVFETRYIGRRQGRLGELPRQFTVRPAMLPMQAMLNYSIVVLVSRITQVVIAKGLDPAFGFLHGGRKPGRLSLSWDLAEFWRNWLVESMFDFADKNQFAKKDFVVTKNAVRLSPPIARAITLVAIKAVSIKEMVKGVNAVVRLF